MTNWRVTYSYYLLLSGPYALSRSLADSPEAPSPAQSPEKKFPLWEIKFVNSVTGIPPG